jgi:uncharacterized membrane protein YdbT with pleckstrin-like domain
LTATDDKGRQELGYIEKILGQDEKLLCTARFHWLRYAEAWLPCLIFFALGAAVSLYFQDRYLGLGTGVVLALAALFVKLLPLWTTEIGVTDHRLIMKRGWLYRTTDELQLKAIEQVSLIQGFSGRIFDYGSIEVHGTGIDEIRVPAIASPLELLRKLQDATAHAQRAAKLSN